MGGIGSGARRSTHIGNVEDMLALDIRVLRRLGVVQAGECVCDTVRWSIGGLSAFCVRLRIDLSDIERGGTMTIIGDMPDGPIRQHIAIEGVPSSLGGWRCYFLSADPALPKLIGLKASRRTPLFNGALECRLLEYRMVAGSNRRKDEEAPAAG